jgi:2-keto-4-pentenoate hydratase/2-oxohepta-3-ene-1,7-dioic acid hydratase in catechol pathway
VKFVTFVRNGKECLGAETDRATLLDLQAASAAQEGKQHDALQSMQALIDTGEAGLDLARRLLANPPSGALVAKRDVKIIAPLPRPKKIRGGSMFVRHLRQAADGVARIKAASQPDPEAAHKAIRAMMNLDNIPAKGYYDEPAYYVMDATTTIGTDEVVEWPAYSDWADFELEIGAVMGGRLKNASAEECGSKIFGYVLLNDLSARDAQLRAQAAGTGGTAKGKEFDGSIVLGPCIVTADELADPFAHEMETRVNGEVFYHGRITDKAQWSYGQIYAFVSQAQTIEPGEIITSGCLPSCSGLDLARMVKRGDTIELDAGPLGVARTKIV